MTLAVAAKESKNEHRSDALRAEAIDAYGQALRVFDTIESDGGSVEFWRNDIQVCRAEIDSLTAS